MGVLGGSRIVFTQLIDQPQHMKTNAVTCIWNILRKTITLPEDKTTRVEAWAKKLMALKKTTQEDLECFVGTLVSTTPAVWQAPLHYRNLQYALLISLKKGQNKFRSVSISHQIVRELE